MREKENAGGSSDGAVAVGLAAVLLAVWHCALAVATPGHPIADPLGTVAALLRGEPLKPDQATGETNTTVLILVLVAAVLALATVAAWWLRRPTTAKRDGLASAAAITNNATKSDPYRQLLGFEGKKPVYVRAEDAGLMIAPPRAGKTTTRVVAAVIDAPGAVVVTSTKAEVLRLTHSIRALKGKLWVFDPEGTSRWPSQMTWDLVAGCEDPVEATERARAMIKAVDAGEGGNVEFFQRAAQTVLSCYLHAAALESYSIDKVVAWAKNTRDSEPYRILNEHPRAAPSWGDELEQYTRGDAGATIQSATMTLNNALSPLRTGPAIRSVMPSRQSFNIDAFLDSTDTLYLVSDSGEGSAAPLTTALVASLERRASIKSQLNTSGKFSTPLTLVLDEAPNIAALPSLPKLMTDSGGRGIIVWAFTQSFAQLEARWGPTGARTMLNGSAVLMVLGGIKEVDLLEQLSRLSGERRVERRTRSHSQEGGRSMSYSHEWEQKLRLEDIRELGQGQALMWYLNHPPAELRMVPWWKRKDAPAIQEALALAEQAEAVDAGGEFK